jgi:hypothetical protein
MSLARVSKPGSAAGSMFRRVSDDREVGSIVANDTKCVNVVDPFEKSVSKLRNPTHGSGWIVQVQPTNTVTQFLESHPLPWVDCSDPASSNHKLAGKGRT